VTEFKDVVNCCPVKVRFAVPVTVTEFKDVFNNCPVTFAGYLLYQLLQFLQDKLRPIFSPQEPLPQLLLPML
jgi:hypothetical protein